MFKVDNFISFHDLTPDAKFLWSSSSTTTCIGWEPEELEGVPAYDVIHPDDIAYIKVAHGENVLNDMVGSQVMVRFKHKDGSWIPCMALFSLCYDYIVTCSSLIPESEVRQISAHTVAMTSIVGSKEEEFERMRRHQQAFGTENAGTWNANVLDPEPRACMILNRFTRNLSIMYASPSCEMIFGVDPELIVGKPFLLFIRADDLCSFVEQSDLAKSSNVVTHMRFWFQSPSIRHEIPCEAMLFGAADGMIAILRRCKPFIRKRLITMGQGLDLDSYSRSRSRSRSRPGYSSSRSNSQHNSNGGYTMTPPKAVSYIDSIPISPSSYKSCTSGASSYSSSSTTQGHRSYHAPLRGLPIGSINAIRNLDQECDRHRPLTSLYRDESNNCGGSSPQPDVLLRQHRVQELDGNDIEEDEDDQYEELEEDEGNVNDMDGIEMLPSREMTAELEYGIDMIHLGRR